MRKPQRNIKEHSKRIRKKDIGSKVLVKRVVVGIDPQSGFIYKHDVPGTIVENTGYEQYYHTVCRADFSKVYKTLVRVEPDKVLAIKLDDDLKDIEGNNVVLYRDQYLKFLEFYPKPGKKISENRYKYALGIIERYEKQNKTAKR